MKCSIWEYVQNLGLSLQSRKRFPQLYFISIRWNCSEVSKQDGWFPLAKIFFKNTRETFISHPHYHKGTFFFGLMVPKRMNKTPVGWGKSKFFFNLVLCEWFFFLCQFCFTSNRYFTLNKAFMGLQVQDWSDSGSTDSFLNFLRLSLVSFRFDFLPCVFIHRCLFIHWIDSSFMCLAH